MEIKRTGFSYAVSAVFTLTGEMYKRMAMCSDGHYDGKCKAANQPGGFLYGWRNRLWFENSKPSDPPPDVFPDDWKSEVTANSDELGLLCKMSEQEHLCLAKNNIEVVYDEMLICHIHRIAKEVSLEWVRLNTPEKLDKWKQIYG